MTLPTSIYITCCFDIIDIIMHEDQIMNDRKVKAKRRRANLRILNVSTNVQVFFIPSHFGVGVEPGFGL